MGRRSEHQCGEDPSHRNEKHAKGEISTFKLGGGKKTRLSKKKTFPQGINQRSVEISQRQGNASVRLAHKKKVGGKKLKLKALIKSKNPPLRHEKSNNR